MNNVIFTVGRFNPPTIGHLKLCNIVKELSASAGCEYKLFTTRTFDTIRNPLSIDDKLKYLTQLIPGKIFDTTTNPFTACRDLANLGYTHATLVIGEDQSSIIDKMQRYIQHDNPLNDIGISELKCHIVPRTKNDCSASYVRALVIDGNFKEFQKYIPPSDGKTIRNLYDIIRLNLGILDG